MTIGFDAAAYRVSETDNNISRPVSVSVQSGSLARNVIVTVQTMDDSATGGSSSDYTINPCNIRTCTCILHICLYIISFLTFNCSDGHARQRCFTVDREIFAVDIFSLVHRATKIKMCQKLKYTHI